MQSFTGIYVCVCPRTCAHYDPQGQKRRTRVYNNTTTTTTMGSPEQCVNMDTMEMHYAIMAGFMHFSLTGRIARREGGGLKRERGRNLKNKTGEGQLGEARKRNEKRKAVRKKQKFGGEFKKKR